MAVTACCSGERLPSHVPPPEGCAEEERDRRQRGLQRPRSLQPSLAPVALFLGASLLEVGRVKEAVPPLQQAVTAMPENAQAREMLARAKLTLGDSPVPPSTTAR